MKRYILTLLLATTLVITPGCRHNVQSTNPVVIQAVTLSDAEKTVNTIAHGLLAADQTIDSLQTSEPDYYATVQPKLKATAKLNEVANQCIVTSLNGGKCDWQTAIINIATEAGKPENLTNFGFKDDKTKQKVQLGFAVLTTGINMAIQFQQRAGGK